MEKELKILIKGERTFIREYIELLRPFIKMRKRQADVFAELIYEAYLRKDIKKDKDRFKLIFDYDTSIDIQTRLKLSPAGYRNSISQLRKMDLITKSNTIHSRYLINPDEKLTLKFKFVLEEENE